MLKWLIGALLLQIGGMGLGFVMGYYYPHEVITDIQTKAPPIFFCLIAGGIIMMTAGSILTAPKMKRVQGEKNEA